LTTAWGDFDVVTEDAPDKPHGSAEALLDTAAMIKNLDLVIGVDTSICHLAGALGRPVWLALQQVPDWRWLLDRDTSPWYPSMRLFRQQSVRRWDDVAQAIAAELAVYNWEE